MRLKKRLLALVLAVVLVLPGVLLSPALPAAAQTTTDLYGTGSADEINIVKLLDMALNKGGMSMSPATIKAFLEYWWNSVSSDLSQCINNADAAISTTQDFVEYIYSALENADHYDQLGNIIKKYVQYALIMEYKSLSDFKQLLLQPETFRKFLLSYVTDQDGNIAGTVDNKLKRYNIGKDFVNMTRQAADAYIKEYEGYYLVPTLTYKDISPAQFNTKEHYNQAYDFLKNKLVDELVFLRFCGLGAGSFDYVLLFDGLNLVNSSYSRVDINQFEISPYNDNWALSFPYRWDLSDIDSFPDIDGRPVYSGYANRISFYADGNLMLNSFFIPFSSDGRSFKVWKSLDAFKSQSVGKSNIYYGAGYSNFDSSVDNSVEFSGSYYSSNSSSYSHDIIQNNIDNSSEVNESTINNITNQTINNITNNYGDSSGSGSGSGGSSSGSGNWWNVGDGISAFIEGVAKLLDFLLKLLGDLIGVVSDFLVSLLTVLEKLAAVGSSFGDFLKAFFGFLPEECILMIVSGIGLMVIVGIIKIFKG